MPLCRYITPLSATLLLTTLTPHVSGEDPQPTLPATANVHEVPQKSPTQTQVTLLMIFTLTLIVWLLQKLSSTFGIHILPAYFRSGGTSSAASLEKVTVGGDNGGKEGAGLTKGDVEEGKEKSQSDVPGPDK